MGNIGLKQFIQPVPSCIRTEILPSLTSCFAKGKNEAVVIIDETHYPVGMIRLRQWLEYRSQHSDCDTDELPIQSVAIAPAHWHIHQFREYVQSLDTGLSSSTGRSPICSPSAWALVDQQGAYLGLLDEQAVWRSLALLTPTVRTTSSPQGNVEHNVAGDRLPHLSCPISPTYSFRDARQHPNEIDDYSIRLFENIPFPVMVQTDDGHVILQNEAWQQSIRQLQHPETIRQQLAQLFEKTRPIDENSVTTVFCELDSSQQDCICTCATKDGQYRTWKFAKAVLPAFPIELTSPSIGLSHPDEAIAPSVTAANSSQEESFQLASLLQKNEPNAAHPPYADSTALFRETQQLWMVIAQDITAQHQLSDSLIAQNTRLIQTHRIKDELFNYLTHELKTPLTAILGLSNLLKDEIFGALNERQTQYTNLLYKSGRQLASLVDRVLTLTHLEAGNFQLHPEWVHLPLLCEQAYKEALEFQGIHPPPGQSNYPLIISEKLTFDLDVQPDALHGFIDKLRLKQILVQLLTNALKYSRLEGEIALRVKRCRQWLVFEVLDTGVGIPAQHQPSILHTFQNFDDAPAQTIKGSGLGLVLVNKLVEVQQGTVSFISKEGEGSTFTVLLPFLSCSENEPSQHDRNNQETETLNISYSDASHAQDRPTISLSQSVASSLREFSGHLVPHPMQSSQIVLIIENNPITITQLTESIQSERHQSDDYQILIARSESEAWQKIRTLHPCCILLDLAPSEILGTRLLKTLKTNPETKAIPVITLSDVATVEEAKRLGADIQITHPKKAISINQYLNRSDSQSPSSDRGEKFITVLYINPDKARTEIQPLGSPFSNHHVSNHSAQTEHIFSPDNDTSLENQPPSVASSENRNTAELSAILHPYRCRVLEIDDISQASILSRVWNPDVMLLSAQTSNPGEVLNVLSQHADLKKLPMITLTLHHTEIANQLKDFKVFPCLTFSTSIEGQFTSRASISPLVEVIRVAAGVYRAPRVAILSMPPLVVNPHLEFGRESTSRDIPEAIVQPSAGLIHPGTLQHAERLAALIKYCQMAGIHASIQLTIEAIASCMAQGSIDGVLIYEGAAQEIWDRPITQVIQEIRGLNHQLPLVIWIDDDHASDCQSTNPFQQFPLNTVDTEVMIGARPIHEVVEALQRAIAKHLS